MPLHYPPPGIPAIYTSILKGATDDPSAVTYFSRLAVFRRWRNG